MSTRIKAHKDDIKTHGALTLKYGFSVFLFLVLYSSSLSAQVGRSDTTPQDAKVWLRFGAGISAVKNYSGISGLVSAHYSTNYGIAGIRYLISDAYGYGPLGSRNRNSVKGFHEIAALWGYTGSISFLEASAGLGAGALWGTEKTGGNNKEFLTLSLPLEAQLLLKPLPFVGIGVALSASINSKSTLSNGLIFLQFSN